MRLQPGLVMPGGIIPASRRSSGIVVMNADASGFAITDGGFVPGTMLQGREPGAQYRGYVRFSGVAVPKNATITSAILSVDQTGISAGSVQPYIRIVAADNAPALNFASIFGATLEAAGSTNTTAGAGLKSYDLTAAVQALVNRAGWASGNSLMVCAELIPNGAATDYNQWRSWDYVTPASRPILTITY